MKSEAEKYFEYMNRQREDSLWKQVASQIKKEEPQTLSIDGNLFDDEEAPKENPWAAVARDLHRKKDGAKAKAPGLDMDTLDKVTENPALIDANRRLKEFKADYMKPNAPNAPKNSKGLPIVPPGFKEGIDGGLMFDTESSSK